ncbi:MAG: OmpA family protein [Thermaerobacter sp.]|nr:OmpA family protein [Thermaerobacter sp.]
MAQSKKPVQRSRRRRRGVENIGEEQAHEATGMMRWLLTYADLITLLMAFFVIMYAVSRVNNQRFSLLREALQTAFNGMPAAFQVSRPIPQSGQQPTVQVPPSQTMQNLYRQVQAAIQQLGLKGQMQVAMLQQGVDIRLPDKVLFPEGRSLLLPSAHPVLDRVAALLKNLPNPVSVRGYADDLPIHTTKYPSNWELSGYRATNVVHYLIAQGVTPSRLSATAYSRYRPLYPNTTAHYRQMNRRVEIVVLRNGLAAGTAP